MKKLILCLLVLVFLGFVFAEEKYEIAGITGVDILGLKKPISSLMITVRGVSLGNTLEEAMQMLGKTKTDLRKDINYWWLEVEPGLKFRIDKKEKKVEAFIIDEKFKEHLQGATASLFNLKEASTMDIYLELCFGRPDKIRIHDPESVIDRIDAITYFTGFSFSRYFDSKNKNFFTIMQITFPELLKEAQK
jgi:hypothetical protein